MTNKTVTVNKGGNSKSINVAGGGGGVVNKGFAHATSVESPTITITTADEVAAQLKAALDAQSKEETAKVEEEAVSARGAAPVVVRGPKAVTPLKVDEVDGLETASALSEAVRRGSDVGKMETIGEEGEEEEDDEEEGGGRIASQLPPRPKAPLSSSMSLPGEQKSRRISQIPPASLQHPAAVRIGSKFTAIPTGDHSQEVQQQQH